MTNKRLYNNPKFTTRRGNIFYVNFRLPSGAFFRQSLGTDSLKVAEVTMSRLMPYIPLVQSGAMSEEAFKNEIAGVRKASKRDVDKFLVHWLSMNASEAQTIPEIGKLHRKMFPDERINAKKSLEQAAGYADHNLQQLHNGEQEFTRLIKGVLKLDNLQPAPEIEPDIEQASSELTMAKAMLYQAYEAFYRGDLLKYKQLTQALVEQAEAIQSQHPDLPKEPIKPFAFGDYETPQQPEIVESSSDDILRLKDAIKMYCTEKGAHWGVTLSRDNNRYLEVLLAILGNVSVKDITKQDMRRVWSVIKSLPKRTLPKYSKLTTQELIELDDIPEEDCASSANAGKHWKIYSSLFKIFLKDEKDILETAPTEGIKIDVSEKRYGNYARPEMKKIVSQAVKLENDSPFKWVLLLLAYTGARRSEITRLKDEQVRKDEATGRHYLMIAVDGGKTDAAQRQVPLSERLIEYGFLEYAKGKKGFLFPRFAGNPEAFTLQFKELRDELSIPVLDDYGDRRVVHSIRHSCISEMISKTSNHVLVQQIVGHEHSQSLGITARYTHRVPLSDLINVIDNLEWL
ncbi:tyrosine-type recombinase/integrase [Enterobacter bugandensis]|uniref:tyrosine-type recombinase/integrase n=1 Tax=Enterobacter bugandensis TaxID=881260 RepID=UPI001888E457|nr:tyrosine-type recombinase/integrase [Enterobacter bugandensis]MBF2746841.1 tyrosine-type recombinase/integrase [Enterobacter bugandensis]MBF2799486.1 tyrosine-type recombinase/integrase [Enterobacter bugandensis]